MSVTVNKKNKAGRNLADCWSCFTDLAGLELAVFMRSNSGICRWCNNTVSFGGKASRVQNHLRVCKPFAASQLSLPIEDRVTWFTTVVKAETVQKNKRKKVQSSTQSSVKPHLYEERILTPTEQIKFENLVGLHFILSGSAFQRADETNFKESYKMLCPTITTPSRKEIAGPILKRLYKHFQALAYTFLIGAIICLGSDGWTNINGLPVVNYIAINPDKSLYIHSVTAKVEHSADWLANASIKVVDKLEANKITVSGQVTDNTSANKLMWTTLSKHYPDKFFYGCVAHALNLLIADLFGPSKTLANNPAHVSGTGSTESNRGLEKMYPPGWPFESLLTFIAECRDLVNFFKNSHYVKVDLLNLQRETGTAGLQGEAATRWGSLEGMAESILRNDANIREIIISDRNFVSNATTSINKTTRQALVAFVSDTTFVPNLRKIIAICAPINALIVKYQSDKVPLSDVYRDLKFELHTAYASLEALTTQERQYVSMAISTRWDFISSPCHGIAYILDPKWLGLGLTQAEITSIEEQLFKWSPTRFGSEDEADAYKSQVEGEYTKYICAARASRASQSNIYKRLSRPKQPLTPINYWRVYCDEYPLLKTLALRIFSMPATSASCERNFSLMGFIHSKLRNRLGPATVHKCTFIKANYEQLKDIKPKYRVTDNDNVVELESDSESDSSDWADYEESCDESDEVMSGMEVQPADEGEGLGL